MDGGAGGGRDACDEAQDIAIERLQQFLQASDATGKLDGAIRAAHERASRCEAKPEPGSAAGADAGGPPEHEVPEEQEGGVGEVHGVRPTSKMPGRGARTPRRALSPIDEAGRPTQVGGRVSAADGGSASPNGAPPSPVRRRHKHLAPCAEEPGTGSASFRLGVLKNPKGSSELRYLHIAERDREQFQQYARALAQQMSRECASLNPHVKALSAHRQAMLESAVDLLAEEVDSLPSRLATQRNGALATLRLRNRGAAEPAAVPLVGALQLCSVPTQCTGTPGSGDIVISPGREDTGDLSSSASTTAAGSTLSEADSALARGVLASGSGPRLRAARGPPPRPARPPGDLPAC